MTLALALNFGAVIHSAAQSASRRTELANVILVVTPDLSQSDLERLSDWTGENSNIQVMMDEGKLWDHYYTGGTDPAMNQNVLLTGKSPGKAWVRGRGKNSLRLEDRTVAEDLSKKGYKTAMIGYWDMGDATTEGGPLSQGFQEWVGFADLETASVKHPEKLWRNDAEVVFFANARERKGMSPEDIFMLAATNFIRIQSDLPFFIYLNYNDFEDSSLDSRKSRLQRLDRDIGILMDALKEQKIHEETALLLIGSRGAKPWLDEDTPQQTKTGLRFELEGLYEANLRTPAILWWPETVEAGSTDSTPWTALDFYPTIAELTGFQPSRSLEGQSALTLWAEDLSDQDWSTNRLFYWEHHGEEFAQALMDGGKKWIRREPGGDMEIYDLGTDPFEKNNLSEQLGDEAEKWIQKASEQRIDSFYWPIPE